MRLVTGSSVGSIQKKISVRLPASGDLFVIDEVLSSLLGNGDSDVTIEIITKRMMLIPTQIVAACNDDKSLLTAVVERELGLMGISYYNDEDVLILSRDVITAIIVVPKIVVCEIDRRYASRSVIFDTPMLRDSIVAKEHAFVDSFLGLTTIKVYTDGGELLFADTYETPTDAYSIYWIERIASALGLSHNIPLYIYRCSKTMQSLLLQTFNKIMICE